LLPSYLSMHAAAICFSLLTLNGAESFLKLTSRSCSVPCHHVTRNARPPRVAVQLSAAATGKSWSSGGALYGTLTRSTGTGLLLASIITSIAKEKAPPLLFNHIAGLSMAFLVFQLASLGAVRSRAEAAKSVPAAEKRGKIKSHVKAHFFVSVATFWSAAIGLASIVQNKYLLGKPHLASTHSQIGALAVAAWLVAWVAAELKVWAPLIKARRIAYEPSWFWASQLHRAWGGFAGIFGVGAVASGIALTGFGRATYFPTETGTSNLFAAGGWGSFVILACGLTYLGAGQVLAATSTARAARRRRREAQSKKEKNLKGP